MSYVIRIKDLWDDTTTAAIVGPFATLDDALAEQHALTNRGMPGHRMSTHKLVTTNEIPEWVLT